MKITLLLLSLTIFFSSFAHVGAAENKDVISHSDSSTKSIFFLSEVLGTFLVSLIFLYFLVPILTAIEFSLVILALSVIFVFPPPWTEPEASSAVEQQSVMNEIKEPKRADGPSTLTTYKPQHVKNDMPPSELTNDDSDNELSISAANRQPVISIVQQSGGGSKPSGNRGAPHSDSTVNISTVVLETQPNRPSTRASEIWIPYVCFSSSVLVYLLLRNPPNTADIGASNTADINAPDTEERDALHQIHSAWEIKNPVPVGMAVHTGPPECVLTSGSDNIYGQWCMATTLAVSGVFILVL